MKFLSDWRMILLLCFTLGLMPYYPEPHIWGKIKWIWGGAVGMELIDWWDTFLHGIPWLLLVRLGLMEVKTRIFSSSGV